MPELPEVETIVRGLQKPLPGASFARTRVLKPDVLRVSPRRFREALQGRRIVSVGRRAKNILLELDDGRRLEFDAMVSATGAAPRKIPGTPEELAGLFTLRTLDDAISLRSAFERNPRVVVVGAGFIGAEVAASARKLGLDVTMIEPQSAPLAHALGPAIGEICAALHRDHGVQLRLGAGLEEGGIEGHGCVESLRLDDGTRIEADVVVVGINNRSTCRR